MSGSLVRFICFGQSINSNYNVVVRENVNYPKIDVVNVSVK